ncbi:putative signal peptide and transmembrane domain [Cryptosporidium hominis]
MKIRKLSLILTLSFMKLFNAFCFDESPKSIKESLLNFLPVKKEKLGKIINGKEIYPLVSLEIKTQQLKLEGEIIPSKIVSRRILIAKGVAQSRLLPNDVLYFNTNMNSNQVVKAKQLVGVVTYSKNNRKEELYSSCDGIIKEVLSQGFHDFEATFFVIYCDLKNPVLSTYFGYSIVPITEKNTVFGKFEDSPAKKEINIKKNKFNDRNTRLISNKEHKKLYSEQSTNHKYNSSLEYQNRQSMHCVGKFQLDSICMNEGDSASSDNSENPSNVKRVEFLYKKCVPNKSKPADSSLTVKLKAYRKSLEALKQSVANITDFSRVGNIKLEDEKQLDFDKQKNLVSKMSTLSIKYRIWISLALTIIILTLIALLRISRYSFTHST